MSATFFLVMRLLMAALLYAFLGWALLLLWQDLGRQAHLRAVSQVPILALVRQGAMEAQNFRFNQAEVSVGRDLACDCSFDDPTISARHARLSFHHGQWWVEDLDSRNGTFLNQTPVEQPVVITSGDILRLGQVELQVLLGSLD